MACEHTTTATNDSEESQYINLLRNVLEHGEEAQGRNAVTKSLFAQQLKFDLRNGFPLITTKKVPFKSIVEELLMFLKGQTNTQVLRDKNVHIWDGNTNKSFQESAGLSNLAEWDMGWMYGKAFRDYDGIDQLMYCINTIKADPKSRRILMTSFNPARVKDGVLWPCHSIVLQFYVSTDGHLDMLCVNRSSDLFLGLPFNIASSALLMSIVAHLTNLMPRHFTITLGDCHIYSNHYTQVATQIERTPLPFPKLDLSSCGYDVNAITYTDLKLVGYKAHPSIIGEMVP